MGVKLKFVELCDILFKSGEEELSCTSTGSGNRFTLDIHPKRKSDDGQYLYYSTVELQNW